MRSHPLAGATMSGADMIIQVLADEGVDTIFGYSGGAILPTYDAVFRYNGSEQPQRHGTDAVDRARERTRRGLHGGEGTRARAAASASSWSLGPRRDELRDSVRDCMAEFDSGSS